MQTTNRFWKFQIVFWLVAGTALFISGTTQTEVLISLVRNVYLTVAGFVSGFFLANLLARCKDKGLRVQLLIAVAAAYVTGMVIVLVINPVTYGMMGIALADITPSMWFGGVMNFALVLGVWCILYLLYVQGAPTAAAGTLAVEKGRQTQNVAIKDILYLKSAGDYVEVHTADRQYLRRGTMASIEKALQKFDFLRIHRSILVNMAHVRGIEAKSKGECFLVLANDQRLKSARTYRKQIEARFADQI